MYRRLSFVLSGVLVSGCASMPAFDAPDDGYGGPTVATVIDKIQCEIAEARDDPRNQHLHLKGLAPFSRWGAAVQLTLTVNDTAGTAIAGLPLSYIHPLSVAATSWTLNASPVLYQTRARTFSQNYTILITSIPLGQQCDRFHQPGFNLEGDLGLREQIYMGLHSFDDSQHSADIYTPQTAGTPPSGASKSDNFGATVSFHIYKGVNAIGPTWTLQTFKGPTAGVGYQRDDLHQIVITFAPAGVSQKVPYRSRRLSLISRKRPCHRWQK